MYGRVKEKMKKEYLSIGDIAKITNVSVKSLRYYESLGVLIPIYTDPDTRYRYYSPSQIRIVDAIQNCARFGIPIRQLTRYIGEDGKTIDYSGLLEYGRKLAEDKIKFIRDGIAEMEKTQQELERNEQIVHITDSSVYDFPAENYLIERIKTLPKQNTYGFRKMCFSAKQKGYTTGFKCGYLYRYHGKDVERYYFSDVVSPVKKDDPDIFSCPAQKYEVRYTTKSNIDDAPKIFSDLFSRSNERTVMEFELYTAKYIVGQPHYQLQCSI